MTQVVRRCSALPGPPRRKARKSTRPTRHPRDAKRVLLFSESSHWDTNWLKTSDEYFDDAAEAHLRGRARTALEQDPRASTASRASSSSRFSGSVIPKSERGSARSSRAASCASSPRRSRRPIRSSLIQRRSSATSTWDSSGCACQGLSCVPRTAYFPDNFGHSPHLPSLMRAVGVDSVAVTRIDGMYFIASDFGEERLSPEGLDGGGAAKGAPDARLRLARRRRRRGALPLERLYVLPGRHAGARRHRAMERRRRGDTLADPPAHRAAHRRLRPPASPVSRDPVHALPDRHGLQRSDRSSPASCSIATTTNVTASTGTWAVLAGMDDYFELVRHHAHELPVLSVDPNPYWMGFYASRPELKQRATRVARTLLLAESLSALEAAARPFSKRRSHEGWHNLVLMNHHDAITARPRPHLPRGAPRLARHRRRPPPTQALALARPTRRRARPLESRSRSGAAIAARGRWRGRELQSGPPAIGSTFSKERGGCLTSLVLDGRGAASRLGARPRRVRRRRGALAPRARVPGRSVQRSRSREPPASPYRASRQTDDAVRPSSSSRSCAAGPSRGRSRAAGRPVHRRLRRGFAARRVSVTCRFEMVDNDRDPGDGHRRREHRAPARARPPARRSGRCLRLLTLQGHRRASTWDSRRRPPCRSVRTMRSSGSWRATR